MAAAAAARRGPRRWRTSLHLVDDLDEVAALGLGGACQTRRMNRFAATNHSEAVVAADREAIWAALTDPVRAPPADPAAAHASRPTATCGAGS